MLTAYSVLDVLIGLAIIVASKKYLQRSIIEILAKYIPNEDVMFMAQWVVMGIVYTIGALLVLTGLGISINNLLVAGGIITLAISFAAQTTISNAISGIFLILEKPVRIGDYVYIKDSGVSGVVKSISIFSTTVRLWSGEMARVPNSSFFGSVIVNQSIPTVRRLEIELGLPYDLNKLENGIEAIIKTIRKEKYILRVPEPEVFIKDFGQSYVTVRVNAWVPTKKWYEVYKEIRFKLYKALKESGIDIPYTTIVVVNKASHDVTDQKSSSTSESSRCSDSSESPREASHRSL